MSFPVELTSVLSGASISQLHRWRSTGLLVPEVRPFRPPLYSFRDVVALRSVVRLRKHTSLQKIRQALYALPEFDLTDHPSQYQLATDGASVAVWTDDGFLDLIKNKGATELFTLADIYRPFQTRGGTPVADFRKPRPHLQVDAGRQGGWPTIEGTRITYDTVAWAIDGDSVTVENVSRFYPKVTPAAAMDAVSFAQDVDSRRQNRQQVAA